LQFDLFLVGFFLTIGLADLPNIHCHWLFYSYS